jgi:T1SS-143 domain-containing protein
MNGPFRVAEVSGTTTTTNNTAPRIYTLTKPLGDQAVVVNLGYDQKVKVDFSSIANEKITLVHIGDKLIILFDNKSTLTVEPFFDSRHDGINNLSIEVAPGRDVSVSEFASLFPITTDQSILPAAGDGNGNAQASGANFTPSSVDPLGIGNPLALLGQEELGNFVVGQDTFDGTPTAAAPTIAVGAGLALTVDESFIPVVGSLQLPAGSTVAVADYSTVFAITAPAGVASQTYALTATGTASNLIDSGTGQTVVLVQKGAGEVDGIVTIEGVAVTVFTLTVDAAGHVTMTDLRAVHEANPADSNDGISLAAGLVSLTVTVTDVNANVATATIDLGPNVTILDDGPTIAAHEGEIPSLNVDESFLTAATNDGVAGSGTGPAGSTTDHGFFAGAFTSVAGADGATIAYKLGIGGTPSGEGGLIDSGLIDSSTGAHVVLVLTAGGVVEGHVGTAAGATVFTLTIDPATAEVTLTQFRSVHEGSPDSPDDTSEGISLDSVANLVTLTATITDGDGDKATASIDLGTHVTFHDDGPSISVVRPSEGDEGGGVPSLNVDESFLTAATNAGVDGSGTGPAGATTDHASFAGMFTSVQGADHAKISYILGIAAPDEEATLLDSGLIDSATGKEVVLVLTPAGVVEGHVGTADGETVFTLTVDAATAEVTLTQLRSVHENTADNPTDSSEGISLDRIVNLVTLTAIIVDNDGDSASASIDIGAQITFHDDGPSIIANEGESPSLNVDESFLTAATNGVDGSGTGPAGLTTDHASFAGLFTSVQGADHATIAYTLGIATPSGESSVVDSGLIDSGTGLEVVLVLTPAGVVEGHVGTAAGETVFTLTVDPATADVTLTQFRAVHENTADNPTDSSEGISLDLVANLVTLTATITDNDGDSASATIDLGAHVTFHDDGPTLSVTAGEGAAVVDETHGLQTANGATDVAFSSLTGAIQTLFNGVLHKGFDPDVSHDHSAIGYAVGTGLVTATVNSGADHIQSEVFALTLSGNGIDSGLATTEGREIYLFLENGVIVGRYDAPHDGNTTVNQSDPAAFAIAIDPATGDISIAQYVSLNHPDQATAADGFNSYNEAISLAAGTVSIAVTVTDRDGDSVTQAADVSGAIKFLDDGPKVTVDVDRHFSVVLDETPGVQFEDDDTTSSSVRHLFDSVTNTGNDPDLSSGQKDHGAIGFAIGSHAALDVTASFGADGPSGECSNAFSLTLNGISGSVDSGLQTTDGKEIYLTLEHGVIVGRVDTDGDHHVSTSDPAAFAIAIDDDGHVATAEYLSLHHGDPHASDESVQLASGTISATVTITDGDGDTASASADISGKIQFEDDAPHAVLTVAKNAVLTIDETAGPDAGTNDVPNIAAVSGLFSAIPGTPIEIAQGSVAVVSASASSYGADGQGAPATYALTVATSNGVDSGIDATDGRSVFLYKEGNLIVGREGTAGGTADANGSVAFAIAIDGSTGKLTVAEYTGLYHHNPLDPNEAATPLTILNNAIKATVTITDGDGDTSVASVGIGSQIHFLDDGPTVVAAPTNLISNGDFSLGTFTPASFGGIASAPGSVTGWVFSNSTVEAPAPGGLQVERVADGYLGLHSSTHGSMIDMAASPGNIQLSQQVSGLVSGQTYAVEFEAGAPYPATAELQVLWNNVVIGTIDPTGPMTSYSYVVTATGIAANDQITFREVGLGHAPIPGEADEGYHGTYLANIAIVATSVVDEDGLTGPLSFGNNDSQVGDNVVPNTDGDNNEATATGNLNIHWGADNADKAADTVTGTFATLVQDTPGGIGNRSVTFTDANVSFAGASSLTSQGVAITFSLNADHTVLTGSAGGRSVFEVSLSDDGSGSYRFVLLDQLDHAPNGNENDIALTFNYTVTDSDGDTASSKFIVSVDDDVPVTGVSATITVDEDDLASGNHNTTSPGDDAASVSPVTGTLNFKVGADEPATVGFASLNGGAVVDTATHAVTAGGVALHYYWDSASHTLYASTSTDTLAHAAATAAFKIQVTDPATGAYSFSLLGQVDHPGHNDGVGGTQTAYEDNININLTYTVTDRDNDTATGTLSVSIDDDIPVIGSGAATNNLIVNGSFEQGHDDLGNNQWSIYHTITGWTSKDIGPAGPAGDVPFELQTGNVGGVFAQNGNTLLELDSDLKSGDLPGGDHFNDSGHTNTIVQQVVAGTVADQSYELTFYYAPRPGEGDADSGSMDVLWNGTVVKTIDSTGMTPGVWQLITVSVVGTGPGDVLAFQGTGQENSYGAFIDNVSLVPVTFVDEDGLTGPLSTGNHDSQPGDNIVPDTDHDANEATSTGNLNIKWGADNIDSGTDTVAGLFGTLVQDHPDGVGDRSVTFTNTNVTVDGVSSLTSHGQAVTFSLNADGTMLTGVAGARTVMEISLSDEGTGAFRVVLLDQLDHAPGNNENDIFLTFNFTATDSDGDAVKSTFTVGVDDDVPVATGGSIFIGEVFEGGLGNSLAPTKVTFSGLALASMVSVGADEPGTIGLNGAVTGIVHDSTGHNVTSQGITVKYAAVGGDVIGFADTNGDNVFTSGEHEIFRLHDNGNGLLTFTLEDQVDGAGSSAGGGHPLILNLATAFKATDFDGDSTVLSGSVSFGVESGTSDPIVLDLGKSGLAFSSSANGVQFDINGDGAKDQVAWTANGEDGILALDVNGSGKIENGNELFTPGFAGGHFANGIAALASLDANHDGVIDSRDPAFSQLVVWQDANHNGVSDAGELTKLADLGIKSIDLATTADAGSIDGQHVAAAGTFTYADGSKGSFAEVDFDTTLGTSTPTGAANDTHSDLPKGGMDHVVDFTPAGHGELNFSTINPGVPAGGEQSHFSFVDAPLMHDTFGDNSAAAAKMALAILQAGGTVDAAHFPVAH